MAKMYGHFHGKPVTPIDPNLPWKWYKELEEGYRDIQSLTVFNWAFTTFLRYVDWATVHDDFIPLGTEVELFAPTGLVYDDKPVYLHGFVDLLVDRAGQLGVVDHKSYNSERGKWTSEMVYFDLQLAFYCVILHLLGYTPDFAEINGINTYEYKGAAPVDKLFSREPVYHKAKRLEAYKDEIFGIIDDMYTAVRYPKRLMKDCKFCGYRNVCDTIMRGRDPLPLLKMSHTKDSPVLEFSSPLEEME